MRQVAADAPVATSICPAMGAIALVFTAPVVVLKLFAVTVLLAAVIVLLVNVSTLPIVARVLLIAGNLNVAVVAVAIAEMSTAPILVLSMGSKKALRSIMLSISRTDIL